MPSSPEAGFCPTIGRECQTRGYLFMLADTVELDLPLAATDSFRERLAAAVHGAQEHCRPELCGILPLGAILAVIRAVSDGLPREPVQDGGTPAVPTDEPGPNGASAG